MITPGLKTLAYSPNGTFLAREEGEKNFIETRRYLEPGPSHSLEKAVDSLNSAVVWFRQTNRMDRYMQILCDSSLCKIEKSDRDALRAFEYAKRRQKWNLPLADRATGRSAMSKRLLELKIYDAAVQQLTEAILYNRLLNNEEAMKELRLRLVTALGRTK
jgi:hypothetical protein